MTDKINWIERFEQIVGDDLLGKKLLLHSCCGPCSTVCLLQLSSKADITVFYYNPNIYPYQEYIKRKDEQIKFINALNNQGCHINFIDCDCDRNIFEDITKDMCEKEGGNRCKICFKMRLEKTCEYGEQNGFDYFATTLTVSPYKNSNVINEIGLSLVKNKNIKYLPTDFKKHYGYKKSIENSKKYQLYRQHYCGCKHSLYQADVNIER